MNTTPSVVPLLLKRTRETSRIFNRIPLVALLNRRQEGLHIRTPCSKLFLQSLQKKRAASTSETKTKTGRKVQQRCVIKAMTDHGGHHAFVSIPVDGKVMACYADHVSLADVVVLRVALSTVASNTPDGCVIHTCAPQNHKSKDIAWDLTPIFGPPRLPYRGT